MPFTDSQTLKQTYKYLWKQSNFDRKESYLASDLSLKSGPDLPKKLFFLLSWKLLRMRNNSFYFTLNALLVSEIFKFCFDFFLGHVGKQLDQNANVNFKTFDILTCLTNNDNIHNAQHRKK